VDAPLGAQPAVGAACLDRDRGALDARRFALGLVHDLGVEPVPLGPAEVHPQEHLGPVRGLGPTGPGTDHQEGPALVVLAAEEEGGAFTIEVDLDRPGILGQLGLQLGVR
jgi:hypothetical protein